MTHVMLAITESTLAVFPGLAPMYRREADEEDAWGQLRSFVKNAALLKSVLAGRIMIHPAAIRQ